MGPDASLEPGSFLDRFIGHVNVATSGYHRSFRHFRGFSHTRLSGAGVREGGLIRVLPSQALRELPASPRNRYIEVRKEDQIAAPGYYQVKALSPFGLTAEFTATSHVGIHRYSFETQSAPAILVDGSSSLSPAQPGQYAKYWFGGNRREIVGESLIFGDFSARLGGVKVFYVATFSEEWTDFRIWDGRSWRKGMNEEGGESTALELTFGLREGVKNVPIEVRVALSFVSIEKARKNLEEEASKIKEFNQLLAETKAAWDARLHAIDITTPSLSIRRTFATALYHTQIMPTDFGDSDGEYRAFDGKIVFPSGFRYRTDLSLWDTMRTVSPLFNLIAKDIHRDSLRSIMDMARRSGRLPMWPIGQGDTMYMIGSPAAIVLAESALKGSADVSVPEVLQFALHGLEREECLNRGYCPADCGGESVSRTLEYAWADHAMASLAEKVADLSHKTFRKRSEAWKNIFDEKTNYFRPRHRNGRWQRWFFPSLLSFFGGPLSEAYTEGSAWQWRWSLLFDPESFVAAMGGPQKFAHELEAFMSSALVKQRGDFFPGGGYCHGNEPSIHAAWLFNEAGFPESTQRWVRWILTNRYSDTEDGLDGQDDAGTLSAWYVFTAMGLYPKAGSSTYWLAAPIVESASVILGNGKILNIKTNGNALERPFLSGVWLNGQRICVPKIDHELLAAGGTLLFHLEYKPVLGGGFSCVK